MTHRESDARIVAALGGAAGERGWADAPGAAAAFLARADFHGVAAILCDRLQGDGDVPAAVAAGLRARAIAALAWEGDHQRILAALLSDLAASGIRPVLFKGTALAYSAYEDPAWRARGDTDILVAPGDRAAAIAVLDRQGFRRTEEIISDHASNQAGYVITGAAGAEHAIDLHWEATGTSFLAGLFSHEELLAHAVPLPRLSPVARAACPADALMIACVHRQKHLQAAYYVDGQAYFDADRLIWLRDIDLLAAALSAEDRDALARRARVKGLVAVCRDGLAAARAVFGTALPDGLADAAETSSDREAPARYLDAGRRGREWMDFRARRGLAAKLRYLRVTLFPPAAYMRWRYPQSPSRPLAWLYLRRAAEGLARRFIGRA